MSSRGIFCSLAAGLCLAITEDERNQLASAAGRLRHLLQGGTP
jgi:hypothetical protein